MKLAIITARGGSKRIPRKNVRPFCGRPIIAYSIAAALESDCFDEVMVSTDDEEIADVARRHRALVPFYRSAAASNDHAPTAAVIVEVLQEYAKRGKPVDVACCLYPTAPFITAEALRSGLRLLESDARFTGVIPVTRFSYPIQRALRVTNRCVEMFQPEHLSSRSQDLEPAYHDVGQFYWMRVRDFMTTQNLMTPRTAALILPEWQMQDIDNEDDWIFAEMKFKMLQQRNERPAGLDVPSTA